MAKRGYKLQEFVAHSSNVNCLNIGKKACRLLLTGGDDHKVNLWAIGKPVSLMSLCGHTSPVESVSFDSAEVLVVAGASNGMIKLWDLEEAKLVRALTGHKSNCTAVGFHPFGEFFASGSMDTNLKIWDIRKKGCIHTYKGHTQGIGTIRFSPDGRWVVSGGLDNIVKVWDLTAGKLLHEFKFHEGHIRSIDFHPLEFLLATGSADKTVKFWDLETFELIGSARPEATGVRSIAFHPDGRTLFCGLEDSLKVYSWEPVIRHDAVDIGWSTLGDLCIHDGKVLGCSYYRNSVGVWVADISLIEPYGSGFIPEQNDGRELKFNLKGSHSVEKVGSSIKGLRSTSSDYESKEIKNIYVDSTDGKPIASQRVGSLSSPKVVVHSDSKETSDLSTLKQSPAVGMPKNNGQPFSRSFVVPSVVPPKAVVHPDSKEASDLSTPKQSPAVGMPKNNGQPFSRSFGAPSVGPPKAVVRSDSKETSDLSTPKQSPAVGMQKSNGQPFSRSFVVPSVVPRDSSDGKYSAKLRRESIGTARTNSDNSIKPVHTRRPSSISKVDVGRLSVTDNSESLSNTTSDQEDSSISRNFKTRLVVQDDAKECSDEKNSNMKSDAAEKFENLVSPQTPSSQKNSDDSLNSKRIAPVKIVNGVAVVRGRTRSLVERFERKEPVVIDDDHTNSLSPQVIPETDKPSTMLVLSPQVIPETDKPSTMLRVEPQISGRELASGNDEKVAEDLLQNHDVFLSILRSRLTKLQVVRHFWERNDIKGAISALRKLPDHAVQADVVSVLMEKLDILNLDLFSCLLPVLVGLLGSKMERHITVSLELLLKLVAVFGPVIRSTVSAPRGVGVDLHAEERREWCNQCFIQLQKIQKIIPELARRGGVLTKCALELNLVLQAS